MKNDSATDRHTVIFDGACGICRLLKRFAEKRDRGGKIVFMPYQSAALDRINPRLSESTVRRSVVLIDSQGRIFMENRAVSRILGYLSGPWPVLGRIFDLPLISIMIKYAYRLIAARRGFFSRRCGSMVGCDR